jgi:hypothetical protein
MWRSPSRLTSRRSRGQSADPLRFVRTKTMRALPNAVALLSLAGSATAQIPLFGIDLRLDRFFTSDTAAFAANFRSLAPYTGNAFAVDFSADATTLWGIDGTTYGTFDLTSGVFTPVGTITGPASVSGLTAAPDGVTWYVSEYEGVSTNSLLWVGDITTGTFTLVGTILTGSIVIDISMDATNRLFGMEISTDNLLGIDTATGAGTLIGPTGFATNFAQGMDFDWTTNTLYAALYTGGGTGTFASLDLLTGAGTALAVTTALNAEMEIAIRTPLGVPNFNVCIGTSNSTLLPARLQVAGSGEVADNSLLLSVHNLPQSSTGYFLNSPDAPFTVVNPGGAQGNLCIASLSQGRHAANVLNSSSSGAVQLQLDLTQMPQPGGPVAVMAGSLWSWQYWYRDTDPVLGAVSNFSNARRVLFF